MFGIHLKTALYLGAGVALAMYVRSAVAGVINPILSPLKLSL